LRSNEGEIEGEEASPDKRLSTKGAYYEEASIDKKAT
jgi:hypothetical protein